MSYCRYGVQLPSLHNTALQEKKTKTEVEQTDFKGDSSGLAEFKQTVDNLNNRIKHDNDYIYIMCAIVLKIAFAQDALRNRKLY